MITAMTLAPGGVLPGIEHVPVGPADKPAARSSRPLSALPEFALAAAACRRPTLPEQLDAALAQKLDWQHFLAVVDRHRVAGLVSEILSAHPKCVPEEILHQLRDRSRRIALRSAATAHESANLTSRLDRAGIFSLIVKGAPLSVLAYGNVAVRHCRDIDLLVAPSDTRAAHETLCAAGYQLKDAELLSDATLESYMQHSRHLEYRHPRTGLYAELHWRLYDNVHLGPPDPITADRTRYQTIELGRGMQVRTLADEDLLLYLCAHGAVHGWSRLKWLADFAALLGQNSAPDEQRLVANRLLKQARSFRLKRAVMQALLLSDRIFETGLPIDLHQPDWAERRLVGVGWSSMTLGGGSKELYEDRFATSNIRLSQLLLNSNPGYLARQVRTDLLATEKGPSREAHPTLLTPLKRIATWGFRKLRFSKSLQTRKSRTDG